MVGINEILGKIILNIPLTEQEKFKLLHSKKIDLKVVEYLVKKLGNLYIEVLGDYEGSLFELMALGKLEGWCWQTTESVIIFLNDDDYIERGNLYFDTKTPKYYHSWICFNYNGTDYVLDPCLSVLCKKKTYYKMFEPDVKGTVLSKDVKEEFLRRITNPKKEEASKASESFEMLLKSLLGDSYDDFKEKRKNEIVINGPENVNTPFYRNGAGYRTQLENGKIKKLTVHYYITDC